MDFDKHYYGVRLSSNFLIHSGRHGMKWYQHIYGDDNKPSYHYRSARNKLDKIIAEKKAASRNLQSAAYAKNPTRSFATGDISSKKNPTRSFATDDISRLKNKNHTRGANGEVYWQGVGTQPTGYGKAGTMYQIKMRALKNNYSDNNEEDEDEDEFGRPRKKVKFTKNRKNRINEFMEKHGR